MDEELKTKMRKFTIPLEFPNADDLRPSLDEHKNRIIAYAYSNGTVLAVLDEEESESAIAAVRKCLESNEWLYEESYCYLEEDKDLIIAVKQLQAQFYGENLEGSSEKYKVSNEDVLEAIRQLHEEFRWRMQ